MYEWFAFFWEYVYDGIVVVERPAISDTFIYRDFLKSYGYKFKSKWH